MDESQDFSSVRWDNIPAHSPQNSPPPSTFNDENGPPSYTAEATPFFSDHPEEQSTSSTNGIYAHGSRGHTRTESKTIVQTELEVEVKDPVRELEGTKDMFVSYLVTGHVGSNNDERIRRGSFDVILDQIDDLTSLCL
jgi:hypothetical protein